MAIENEVNAQSRNRSTASCQWCRYTVRSLIISQSSIILAIALYIAGAATYFADFNFASGGDARGAMMILGAVCLSVFALIGVSLSVYFSLIAWRYSGSPWWPAAAILLPSIEAAVIVCVYRAL